MSLVCLLFAFTACGFPCIFLLNICLFYAYVVPSPLTWTYFFFHWRDGWVVYSWDTPSRPFCWEPSSLCGGIYKPCWRLWSWEMVQARGWRHPLLPNHQPQFHPPILHHLVTQRQGRPQPKLHTEGWKEQGLAMLGY